MHASSPAAERFSDKVRHDTFFDSSSKIISTNSLTNSSTTLTFFFFVHLCVVFQIHLSACKKNCYLKHATTAGLEQLLKQSRLNGGGGGGGGVFPKRKHYRIGTYLFEQGEVMERKTAFVVLEGHAKVQIIEKVRGCKISAVEC